MEKYGTVLKVSVVDARDKLTKATNGLFTGFVWFDKLKADPVEIEKRIKKGNDKILIRKLQWDVK